jgi:hypothetical protein
MRLSLRRYVAIFAIAAGVVGLGYRAIDRGFSSLQCHFPLPTGHFLALCDSSQFGDYEHGAYYYGLEPEAVEHLRRADVTFFGSSRAQIALSTQALTRFFSEHRIAPYLLGFGYNEQGAFPLALVQMQKLKPKAIIILADPFFQNRTTPHIRSNQWLRWRVITEFYEFAQKKLFIAVGSRICSRWSDYCRPPPQLVSRSKYDGSWRLHNFEQSKTTPIGGNAYFTFTAEMAGGDRDFAERFIAATGVSRECVILTAAPTNSMRADGYVAEMGRLLGATVSLPNLNDLTTPDGSHLTAESAERWSAALLTDVQDAITRCARK